MGNKDILVTDKSLGLVDAFWVGFFEDASPVLKQVQRESGRTSLREASRLHKEQSVGALPLLLSSLDLHTGLGLHTGPLQVLWGVQKLK